VKESPVQFECKVRDIIYTGEEGGAGNLIICEMLLMHVADEVLTATGGIDQEKLDLVARAGYDYYVRANKGLFEVPKPNRNLGMGVDALPESIRLSKILTGNDLGMLANEQTLPDADSIEVFKRMNKDLQKIHTDNTDEASLQKALHQLAHKFLENNKPVDAWKVLLS
jgi:hypothetical protein